MSARPCPLAALVALLPALLALVFSGGCEGATGRDCVVDADCASGSCLATGECEVTPSFDTTTGPDGGGGADATFDATDGASDRGDVAPGDGDADATPDDDETGGDETGGDTPSIAGCQPDHDGVITAAEAPFAAGFSANFLVTTAVEGFATDGDCGGDGCTWDLVEVAGETAEQESLTESLDGKWYADEPAFASATYTTRLGEFELGFLFFDLCSHTQYGVFEATGDALLLLGIVSETEDGGTKLVYDPPLPMAQFPLEAGASWQVQTSASGPFCGSWVDYHIDQTQTAAVDAVGTVETPYGTFTDVLRVNSLLERHLGVGVLPTKVRTHTFFAECFTSVAVIVSEEGVADAEFDAVAEVRRLTNLP